VAGSRIVLDSGALSALAAGDGTALSTVRKAVEDESQIVVPSVVIAESTTASARDATTNLVLRALSAVVIPLDEPLARAAGSLRYRARRPTSDTIDAVIVATADSSRGSIILTGDDADIRRLASVEGKSVVLSTTGRK
jgi:predicted nucleic acid-binding protein